MKNSLDVSDTMSVTSKVSKRKKSSSRKINHAGTLGATGGGDSVFGSETGGKRKKKIKEEPEEKKSVIYDLNH